MVSTDSCLAESMNEQVFTTMMSASSARGVIFGAALREQTHHDLAVHQVLGTAKADKSNFLASSTGRSLRADGLHFIAARLRSVQQGYRIGFGCM